MSLDNDLFFLMSYKETEEDKKKSEVERWAKRQREAFELRQRYLRVIIWWVAGLLVGGLLVIVFLVSVVWLSLTFTPQP